MATRSTKETKVIERLLAERFPGYPEEWPPRAYRYNSASIRIRIVHAMFEDKTKSDRDRLVRAVIRTLPEETQSDITVLLLLTPEELDASMMNREFEHPSPSAL
ncbi:MAG: hypothetical protein AB7O62_09745 [Pirellulales bacterium]